MATLVSEHDSEPLHVLEGNVVDSVDCSCVESAQKMRADQETPRPGDLLEVH